MIVRTLAGLEFNLIPSKLIGSGGEAEIFKIDNLKVAKIFKTEKHQDFTGNLNMQAAVKAKLANYEDKLSKFPTNLPNSVVSPIDLLFNTKGNFVGYTMQIVNNAEVLMKLSERRYKEQSGFNATHIVRIYGSIHSVVKTLHNKNVVIGDFNDLNIMFKLDESCYFIDVDSYQYNNYKSTVYTEKFVDPLKCNDKIQLQIPHDENSDWYAFSVMLTEALLCVGPYGGIHKPKSGKKFTLTERIKHRISIFSTEIQYPKPAYPIEILPPDLHLYLESVVAKDKRGEFPVHLLSQTSWHLCKNCNNIHGNFKCPYCQTKVQINVKVQHNIKVRFVYETDGHILYANFQDKLRFISTKNGDLEREDSSKFHIGNLHDFRFRIMKDSTILAKHNRIVIMTNKDVVKLNCQKFGNLPLIDANSRFVYFVDNDVLYRTDTYGNFRIGDVIGNSTLFWTGEKFGFGFYRAGELLRGFVFDAEFTGINDNCRIEFKGNLIDSTCTFTDDLCWFFVITQVNGKRVTIVHIINKKGEILERHEDPSWLSRIRGNSAHKNQLFIADDDGISRYEIGGNVRSFVGTKDLCDIDSFLIYADNGIYVIDSHKITHLQT